MHGNLELHQFAASLVGERHAWWLGAGASFSAGIPNVIAPVTKCACPIGQAHPALSSNNVEVDAVAVPGNPEGVPSDAIKI